MDFPFPYQKWEKWKKNGISFFAAKKKSPNWGINGY